MRLKKRFSLLVIIILSNCANAQQLTYPRGVFQAPMDTPLYLSAPFGSLRDNHFHSGMDIRTYEKEGLPVYAIADGYISRIKYSPYGYGKALYIDHPNGYTSVYGHLQNANGYIAAYIKKYQYQIQNFDFDHFPGRDKILVKKGDTIGWSGNSGGSTGPHLHFEIRDTKTEEIINPQFFGILPVDSLPPTIRKLYSYTFDESGSKQLKAYVLNYINSIVTDSGTLLLDTVFIPRQCVGFGVEAIDYLVNRKNEYSIYGLDLRIDNKRYYQFRLDRFLFAQSRSINRHIDFATYKTDGNRIQKLFVEDGNQIHLYPYLRNNGKYCPVDTLAHQVKITAYDFMMRAVPVYATIKSTQKVVLAQPPLSSGVKCFPQKQTSFQNAFIKVTVPEKSLYDTLNIEYELLPKEKDLLSATHRIHNMYTPLQKNITIAIKLDELLKPELHPKLVVAYSANGKNWRSVGGGFENGFVTVNNNLFGFYAVSLDTAAPVIMPLFKPQTQYIDTVALRFKITDNFSGVNTYKLLINGKWTLAEYDAKNDMLAYFFDKNTPNGKLEIELIVTDKKANSARFKTTVNRVEGKQ